MSYLNMNSKKILRDLEITDPIVSYQRMNTIMAEMDVGADCSTNEDCKDPLQVEVCGQKTVLKKLCTKIDATALTLDLLSETALLNKYKSFGCDGTVVPALMKSEFQTMSANTIKT